MKKLMVTLVVLAFLVTSFGITGTGTVSMANAAQMKHISVAGAGTAGTFYVMASGVADLINKKMGINAVAEVTAGSVENMKLLEGQNVELAVSQLDVMQNALAGKKQFSKPVTNVVAIAPLYPNVVQIVTLADSSIESFADLKGKKVSVGSPGSGILATNQVILETMGMSMKDIEPEYLSFAETTNAFRDGSIDAAIVNTAAPAPWVVDLETTHKVKLIELSKEEREKFTSKFPHFVDAVIPAEAYNSMDEDVDTFAVWITLAGRKDLPEEDVYNIVKTIFDNQDFLSDVHVVGKNITLDNVTKIAGVDFHPGASKYYSENGVEVPAAK